MSKQNKLKFLRHEMISNKRQEISFPLQYKRIRLRLPCLFNAANLPSIHMKFDID